MLQNVIEYFLMHSPFVMVKPVLLVTAVFLGEGDLTTM